MKAEIDAVLRGAVERGEVPGMAAPPAMPPAPCTRAPSAAAAWTGRRR